MPAASSFRSWFAIPFAFFTPAKEADSPPARSRRRHRYAVERLESRTLFQAVSWASANSGDWDVPDNWSNDAIPTAADDVTINMPGVTVTHSTGSDAANNVTSSDPILLTGGTLSIGSFLTLNNTFTLAGGLLDNAAVNGTPDELMGSSVGGILNNVELDVDMLIPDGASVTVENNIALDGGNINLAGATQNTQLNFINSGPLSIEGGNSIIFGGTAPQFDSMLVDDTNGGLSISSSNGISGTAGTITSIGGGGTFEMDGTLSADGPGPGITLSGPNWDNEGTFQAINGGTLSINTTPTGAGTYVENNSTLNLGGMYGTTNFVQRTGGVINLSGTLQSDEGTETFDTATGSWNLLGGTVANATLAFTGGNALVPTSTPGSFNNVTLDNDLDVPAGAVLEVTGGLVLNNATMTIESSASVDFNNGQSQIISGTGQITLNGGTLNSIDFSFADLTVGAGITITGAGTFNIGNDDVLQGTISADGNSTALQLLGTNATNEGTVQAINGGVLDVDIDLGAVTVFTETNATINFEGFLTSLPNVTRTNGTLNIAGTFILGGLTQTFDATTGPWTFSGTITDGSLAFSATGALIPTGENATLDNITLDSPFTIPDGVNLIITDNLTLNNTQVIIASNQQPTALDFNNDSSQLLEGTGQIVFAGGAAAGNSIIANDVMGSLTVMSGITIDGTSGTIQTTGSGGSLTLQGVVSADNAGGTIVLQGPNIDYQGTIQAVAGTLDISGDFQASHTGSVNIFLDNGVAGRLNISGNAALDGTLNILTTSGFAPQNLSVYNIITYGAVTGAFATVNGLTSGGITFTPNFGPSIYQLTVTSGGSAQGAAPDVYITSLDDSGGNYLPGDGINGGGIITVFGGPAAIGGYTIQVYLSQDAIFGNADDILLQAVSIPGLAGNSTMGFQFNAQIPANTPSGSYRLITSINPDAGTSDSDTNSSNNVFISALTDIVVVPPPGTLPTDLFPTNLQYTPGTYNPGDTFTATGTANNTGPGATGAFDVSLILSEDGVYGSPDNVVLSTISVNGFSGAGSGSGPITATIPAGIPYGNYHVMLALDTTNVVAETNENNNVLVSPLPDVVIPAPVVPPAPQPVKIGSPNPNFGVGGLAAHDVGITTTSGVAVQSDGKSVIVGTTGTAGAGDFALTRYTTNGSLDTTFGNQGKVSTDFGGDDQAVAVTILADGTILVVGTSIRQVGGQPAGSEFALALYNSDGTLDTAFGNGTGMVLTSFSSNPQSAPSTDIAHAVVVVPNGTIYVAGSSDANGTGKDFAVAAYNPDGSLQTSFGGTGKVLVDFTGGDDSANAIAIQKGRQIILAGSTQNPASGVIAMGVVRLKPDGTIDKTFGKNGRVTRSLRGQDDEASSVAIQKDGQIIIGGFSATGSAADGTLSTDFALVRFTATGSVSKSFGHGSVITSFGQPSAITKILIASDGKIIASGKTTGSIGSLVANQLEVALARYNTDGSLDKTFSATGTAIITLQGTQVGVARQREVIVGATTLMQQFNVLIQSSQGALAMSQGGDLLDVGNSGTDTVEASIVTAGVDLAARIVGTVKASAVGGKKGTLNVSIKDSGPDSAAGAVTLSLFISTDTSAGAGAMLLKSLHPTLRLNDNQSKSFSFSFAFPTGLAVGSYFLVAQLDSGTLPETNLANNTVASRAIHITQSVARAPARRRSVGTPQGG